LKLFFFIAEGNMEGDTKEIEELMKETGFEIVEVPTVTPVP
jgi:hypothetical protein